MFNIGNYFSCGLAVAKSFVFTTPISAVAQTFMLSSAVG